MFWLSPSGESTTLELKVENPSENDYENVTIIVTTEPEHVTLSYDQEENREVRLHPQKPLRHGEESKLYVCDVSGTLPSGWVSGTVRMEAQLVADGETTDERTVLLTIERS